MATAAFFIGNIGYVGIGFDRNSKPTNDFWAFDPATNTWTQKASFKGEARGNAVGFTDYGKGFVGTGSNGTTFYNNFSNP
ncbi:kelch repeat-containing protein [Pedobacter suwonensis]|uniref:kelch repeat-containing protein n=1 Tax=Pedobacter suwonensis TaxID=332999 RepID=UPI000B844511|nr:kelch repeat-containing protein [Pedobacter suwonensis]